jgi:gluconate 2-dehydrogenase gamma chain
MHHGSPTRRDFLQRTGTVAAGAWMTLGLAGCREAARSASESAAAGDTAPRVLTDEERRTLDALADRIIPPDGDAPGARGAEAVVFMDHYAAQQPAILEGLRAGLPGLPAGVAELDAAGVDGVLRDLEQKDPGFFGMVQFLTVVGTFGLPERGGNKDQIGWKMVGFDARHAWQPPFGYYDAQAAKDAAAGAGQGAAGSGQGGEV